MDVLDLTRLQFAVVTIYHYLFVPLSISLAAIAAGLESPGCALGQVRFLHLTTFVGKLLIVTFAVGVVTGLVQEFQFGMGWSAFAKFYGDVFGPTLAIEGMLAFFLEATFLALWYFGWDRLPRAAARRAPSSSSPSAPLLSAFIILAANSFMQNPVAYALDPVTGRAHLTSFTDLLLNKVNLAAFPHTLSGAVMIGGALLLAIGVWRRLGRPRLRNPGPPRRVADPGRRCLDRPHRRPPGQGDHPGPADEDGRRRGALRDHHRRAVLAGATASRGQRFRSTSRICCPSWPRARPARPCRASTTCRPSTPPSSARAATSR